MSTPPPFEAYEDEMLRGQAAPLSPNEEITLRRIALGVVPPEELPSGSVRRLKALRLVEMIGEKLVLTPVGRNRYESLPRATEGPEATILRRALATVVASFRPGRI